MKTCVCLKVLINVLLLIEQDGLSLYIPTHVPVSCKGATLAAQSISMHDKKNIPVPISRYIESKYIILYGVDLRIPIELPGLSVLSVVSIRYLYTRFSIFRIHNSPFLDLRISFSVFFTI